MTARGLFATVGAVLMSGAALAGCSSGGEDASPEASEPAASASSTTAPTAATSAPGAEADPGAQADGSADGDGGADGEGSGGAAPQEAAVPAGGRCDIGQQRTEALVVGGSIDCGSLNDVWSQAVADPAFATHGNRNTIVVGDWTCRAHQTRPVQTGYCENPATQTRFKVIHR